MVGPIEDNRCIQEEEMVMMNCRKQFYGLAVLIFIGGLAGTGCAWLGPVADPTRFYVLEVPNYRPVSEEVGPSVTVGVDRVLVARYLDSPGLTIREGDNRIIHSQRHRWAESMQHGIPRVMAENLRREPAVSQVVIDPGQRRQRPDYDLHLSILRAEGVALQEEEPRAAFHATWELRAGPEAEVVARGRVDEDRLPWNGHNFDQLAASMSSGVEQLSQQVARALNELRR